ncbi:MAG: PspC domain-containing protein [Mycobacterium leprae]
MRELTRCRDKRLLGVAGGMADYFEIDRTLCRVLWLVGGIFFPPAILAYLILGIVLPQAPAAPQTPPPFTPEPEPQPEPTEPRPPRHTYRRMTKSRDKWLSGVAGGIAEYFDLDPVLVRALFLLSLFLGGTGLVAYIVLAIVMPQAPREAC